jgi:hypothetical protein
MPELTKKQFDIELKQLDEEQGTIRAILSSGVPDRQGDMVDQSTWNLEEYKKNPIVLWAHDHTQPAIAQALDIFINAEGMLEALIKFAVNEYEFAKTVFQLYAGKFMRAFSVGFVSNKIDEVNGIRILKENTLYEFSAVNVGADALALAKTKGIDVSIFEKEKKEEKKEEKTEVEKPYPNEHSCRLNPPDKYDKFARKNCEMKHDGKCIDVIFGIKDNKSEIQAFRYDKDIWTESAAKAHCASHDGTFEAASGKEKECKKCETEKEGRVISTKHRGLIERARDHLNEVLKADDDSKTRREEGKGEAKKINYKKALSKAIRELIDARNE